MPSRIAIPVRPAALIVASIALTACGGDDSGGDSPPAAPASVTISGRVADGPLSGVTVCHDLNDNSRCDSGEPASAPTDADGRYSIAVDPALAGRHRVVAQVPASAVDKDTGAAVGTAFTLVAPATGAAGAQQVFVSPLTSLVQARIDSTGATRDAAAAEVRALASLAISPLADFTETADDASHRAATVARLAQLTINRQTEALGGVVGQTDLSGAVVTRDELHGAAVVAVLGALPAVAAAAAEPPVAQATTPAARETALAQAAQTLASDHVGLSAEEARARIGLARLPADKAPDSPVPTATVPAFRYQDADNWYYRAFLATAADNTPDGSARTRYYEQRVQRTPAGTVSWGYGSTPERAGDLHWNGNAWVDCPVGFRNSQTVPDASGRNEHDYCNGFELGMRNHRTSVDIAGRSMRSVVEMLRALPGGSGGVTYSQWGPADLGLLGDATMPAGARLFYQSNSVRSTAVAYDPRSTNEVVAFTAPIAAGGDARGGANPACRNGRDRLAPTSLEDMAARNPGQPCIFTPDASTGDRNEWWNSSTASLGSIADARTPPAGTGGHYSSTANLRVGFVPGSSRVNYFNCLQRTSDGSSRNCDLIGTGSYRIQTLGDARVMHFDGVPALALRSGFSRVYVERGGKVWYGFQLPVGASQFSGRLNLAAANALFDRLGVPPLAP